MTITVGMRPLIYTPKATTSGTTSDFGSIPSWARRITCMLLGVSVNNGDNLLIQLGDSGGIETTGYVSGSMTVTNAAHASADATAGFLLGSAGAGGLMTGGLVLTLYDPATNTWVAQGAHHSEGGTRTNTTSGRKALSAVLTTVRLTSTTPGAFDAGAWNIQVE